MSESQRTAAVTTTDGAEARADELTQHIAALEGENRILQQLEEYRSTVISRVAHELRTPLTSILGFAEILLSQERLTPQQRSFCERIQNSGQQLQNLVSQLSEIAHLESRKPDFHLEEFALEDLLSEVANSSTTRATRQGIHLELTAVPGLPLITSDRGTLRQALRMLLDYVFARITPGGGIHLSLEEKKPALLVRIETKEDAQPDSTIAGPGNSDLSLAIARHTLNLLGATLSIDERRARFSVELPLHP